MCTALETGSAVLTAGPVAPGIVGEPDDLVEGDEAVDTATGTGAVDGAVAGVVVGVVDDTVAGVVAGVDAAATGVALVEAWVTGEAVAVGLPVSFCAVSTSRSAFGSAEKTWERL